MQRITLLKNQLSNFSSDFFSHVPKAPLDPILGTTILYKADTDPNKVDLGVGAYRTEEGKPYVFEVIKDAEKLILDDLLNGKSNKEYQPGEGNAQFLELSKKVVFGNELYSSVHKRVASVQACGGTGALRTCADFLKVFNPTKIYLPKPTWGNHNTIFERAGLEVDTYPYWNNKTRGLDFENLKKRFEELPNKSFILLHSCAHNPTGVDPTPDQWKELAVLMKRKNHYPIFDNAYQGFASGDLDTDGFAIRHFTKEGFQMIVTQSYSKTMGLYGERAGCFHMLCDSEKTMDHVLSQLKIVIRVNFSNPPLHPMKLALTVLSSETLYKRWTEELRKVAGRIIEVRKLLRSELERIGTPGDWSNITSQIGMFSYTGLSETQSERMIKENHVYMLKNGRISMAGLTTKNVKYVAEGMKKAILAGN